MYSARDELLAREQFVPEERAEAADRALDERILRYVQQCVAAGPPLQA